MVYLMEKNTSQLLQMFTEKPLLTYPLALLLVIAPFLQGLYFEQAFYPFLVFFSLLFIISLYDQVKKKELMLFNRALDWAMLALLISYLISLFSAASIHSAVVGIMRFSSYVMMFWLCLRLARQPKGYTFLSWVLYFTGFSMAVFGLLVDCGILQYVNMKPGDRITGMFDYANTFGIYVAIISIIGWGLILSSENIITRILVSGGNAVLLIAMLGSLSRGTWLLYPFAVILFLFLVGKGKRLYSLFVWFSSLIPAFIMARLFLKQTPTPVDIIFIILGFIIAACFQFGAEYVLKRLSQKNLFEQFKDYRRWILIIGFSFILCIGLLYVVKFNNYSSQSPFARLTNISLQDTDLQLRLQFNKDAIKIIKDYPLIGVGAGGWEAVYHKYASQLYWSDKPHNYFLQVGVENGIIGFLALLSIWLMFIKLLWDYYKKKISNNDTSLFWAGATACFLLGAHSLIDFDMSYSAIAFILYGLMGALEGHTLLHTTVIEKVVDKKKPRHKQRNINLRADRIGMVSIALASIAALCLFFTATSFWAAYRYFKSAQGIMNQEPNQALVLFDKALQYDPLNAAYWNQYAMFWSAVAVANQQPNAHQQALAASEKAVGLDPYNLKILNGINQVYSNLGEYERAVNLAETITDANPRDPGAYENLAMHHILKGLQDLDSGRLDQARTSWEKALTIPNRVPSDLEIPPVGLHLTSGQALLLLGNAGQGEQQLRQMLTYAGEAYSQGVLMQQRSSQLTAMRRQTQLWLIAFSENQPDMTETDLQEITRIKGWLSKVGVSGS
jgi:O-antigen ligase/tetratricopeptide (TPR) repeat protein